MRTSDRPHRAHYLSKCGPKRKYITNNLNNLNPRGTTVGLKKHNDSLELMRIFFCRMKRGIWWRIIPTYNDLTNLMTFGMSQQWEYCLPLLINIGYIKKLAGILVVVKEKWNNLQLFQDPDSST